MAIRYERSRARSFDLDADPAKTAVRNPAAAPAGRLHSLRSHCQISHADAARLYGPHATWKKAGQRLLDEGCHQDDMRKTAVCRLREVIKGLARARQLANERDNEPHVVQRGLFAFTVLAFFLLWIAASMGRARSPIDDRTIDHDL